MTPSVDGNPSCQESIARADWQAPLLITGCARSGTTALARLLSTHGQICIFNEYSLYWPPVLEESVWHRIHEMRDDNPPPKKIATDMPSLRSRFTADVPVPVCDRTIRDWIFGLAKGPVRVYGDKMPYVYLDNMEKVVDQFPGARFLLALRDGRAVVASQIRQYRLAVERGVQPDRWMHPTFEEAEFLWLRSVKKWLSLRDNQPAPCLEVRYEQATQSPAELARSICDFVGMEYSEKEFATFLKSYQPIHADAWRDELPDVDAQLSDEFRDALDQLGYR
jgi:hypothetical protein